MNYNGQVGADVCNSTSVESPLSKSFSRLIKSIEILEDKQSKLRARLEPFRRSMAYPSVESVKRSPQSKMNEAIEVVCDRLMAINDETQRTMDELDF